MNKSDELMLNVGVATALPWLDVTLNYYHSKTFPSSDDHNAITSGLISGGNTELLLYRCLGNSAVVVKIVRPFRN